MDSTAQQLITQLEATTVFNRVSLALNVESVIDDKSIVGSAQAWVVEYKTNAQQNSRDLGSPVQIEQQLFAVIIAIKQVNDVDGGKAALALDDKRAACRKALFGFIPASLNNSYTAFTLAGARLLHINNPLTFWAEIFQTTHQIDSENLI